MIPTLYYYYNKRQYLVGTSLPKLNRYSYIFVYNTSSSMRSVKTYTHILLLYNTSMIQKRTIIIIFLCLFYIGRGI